METKCERKRMEEVRLKLGFDYCFVVECRGKSGGIGLLWNSATSVSVKSYTDHHIDAEVVSEDSQKPWRLTYLYGWPKGDKKHHTWSLLEKLESEVYDEWMVMGDFNQVMTARDKKGGLNPDFNLMIAFRETMERCELGEISLSGLRFTWDDVREEEEFIQERLDYVFANEPWLQRFPGAVAKLLERQRSDHVPVLVRPLRCEETSEGRRASLPDSSHFGLLMKDVRLLLKMHGEIRVLGRRKGECRERFIGA